MQHHNPQESLLSEFGTPTERVLAALDALKNGQGVLVLDDEDRENEGDLIYASETLTAAQMALLIRECSGIVCLCITEERARQLDLPPMVDTNNSKNQTAFTVTIEAKEGVTTGVSAQDRVTTVKTAIADNAKPEDTKGARADELAKAKDELTSLQKDNRGYFASFLLLSISDTWNCRIFP